MKHPYEILFEGWQNESNRFWITFNGMSILNALLAAALVRQSPSPYLVLPVAFFGFTICIFWFGFQLSYFHWVLWWRKRLEAIEEKYFEDFNRERGTVPNHDGDESPPPLTYQIFRGRQKDPPIDFGVYRWRGLSTHKHSLIVPLLLAAVWLTVFLSLSVCTIYKLVST